MSQLPRVLQSSTTSFRVQCNASGHIRFVFALLQKAQAFSEFRFSSPPTKWLRFGSFIILSSLAPSVVTATDERLNFPENLPTRINRMRNAGVCEREKHVRKRIEKSFPDLCAICLFLFGSRTFHRPQDRTRLRPSFTFSRFPSLNHSAFDQINRLLFCSLFGSFSVIFKAQTGRSEFREPSPRPPDGNVRGNLAPFTANSLLPIFCFCPRRS